jgi:hypothetical protein
MEVFASWFSSGGRTIENRNSAATHHSTASQRIPLIQALAKVSPILLDELNERHQGGRPSPKKSAPAEDHQGASVKGLCSS